MPDFTLHVEVLNAFMMTYDLGQSFDAVGFAVAMDYDHDEVTECMAELEAMGLVLRVPFGAGGLVASPAGHQFAERAGAVAPEIAAFMPRVIRDLFAREAFYFSLMSTGQQLMAEIAAGRGGRHLADVLFHPAWADHATDDAAVGFVGAAGMLSRAMVDQVAPATIAEEVLFARVAWSARTMLSLAHEAGLITARQESGAQLALGAPRDLLADGRIADFLEAYFAGLDPRDAARPMQVPGSWFAPVADAYAVPGTADPVPVEPTLFFGDLTGEA